MQDFSVRLVDHPDPQDMTAVKAGLSAYNVRKMPELLNLPDVEFAVFIRDEQGVIQGGAVAEVDLGMFYLDLLWIQDDLRGKDYGGALMHTIEQTALDYGIPHVYLMTTNFQALPFYQHIGYEIFGTLQNRPNGYGYYYLCKMNIKRNELTAHLPVTLHPAPLDVHTVNRGLRTYCEQFADCSSQPLGVFIYDADGEVRGGIVGSTYWDWFDLRYFWIDETLQIQEYGRQLLQLAESECRQRGMIGITCDTSDLQSLSFYQSQGFDIFATLSDRPPKHDSYFLKKLL